MAHTAQGASAPAHDPILPVVVQFNHYHDVRVETDAHGCQRVVARVKPGSALAKPQRMRDLPFVGAPAGWNHLCWWYFPKASNSAEADERGAFFWDQFVTYARGTRQARGDDARRLLRLALESMANYEAGKQEAGVFLERLAEAVVAHLRVGLDDGPAPGRKAKKVAGPEGGANG